MEGTVAVVQMCALSVCLRMYSYARMCMCVCMYVCVQESQSKAVGECKSEYERILSEQDRRHKVCVCG